MLPGSVDGGICTITMKRSCSNSTEQNHISPPVGWKTIREDCFHGTVGRRYLFEGQFHESEINSKINYQGCTGFDSGSIYAGRNARGHWAGPAAITTKSRNRQERTSLNSTFPYLIRRAESSQDSNGSLFASVGPAHFF